jgi:hypothetical protein
MSIKPIKAQVVCARDALLQDFAVELLQQGFKPSTVVRKKKLFADLNDWLQVHELSVGDLSFQLVIAGLLATPDTRRMKHCVRS